MSGVLMSFTAISCVASLATLLLSLPTRAAEQEAAEDLGMIAMKAVLSLLGSDPTNQRRGVGAAPVPGASIRAQAILPLREDVFVVACTEIVGGSEDSRADGLVAAHMTTNGVVLAYRTGANPLKGMSSRCQGVGVLGHPTADQPWPPLDLRYQSQHAVTSGEAVIDWTVVVDPRSMQAIRRLPIRLGLRPLDGPPRLEFFATVTVSDTSAELQARTIGRKVLVPCANVCVIEPATVLTLVTQ
jgi:hypothetical protein